MGHKKCNVVMLPTNEKADIYSIILNPDNKLRFYPSEFTNIINENDKYTVNHLHVLSDDEIKVGDWIYGGYKTPHTAKKIIASTDACLNLPQLSDSFIAEYIKSWNKGNKIEEVMVEYESAFNVPTIYDHEQLKVSKDNIITIKNIKDSFTFEEVERMISRFIVEECPEYSSKGNGGTYIHKCIKEGTI